MKRQWVLALAALVSLPGLTSAQGTTAWGPHFRITPYVGVSPNFSQKGTMRTISGATETAAQYQLEYPTSLPVGLNVEYRFWRRFGALVGAGWQRRGNATLIDLSSTDSAYLVSGNDLYFGKADLMLHLYERNSDMQLHRVSASVFAGPIYIKDRGRTTIFTPPGSNNTIDQWGLNLGAEAEIPSAAKGFALVIGLENSMIFWNNNQNARRVEGYFRTTTPDATVLLDAENGNLVLGRIGLSYRF